MRKHLAFPPFWLRCLCRAALILGTLALTACQPEPSAVTPSPPEATPTLRAAIRLTAGEWKPYTGEELSHYGCDAWVVSEAFSAVGITAKYGFFPWARAYDEAVDGNWDGTVDWADTPEHREAFFLSAEPLSEQEWAFFYRTDEPFDWQTFADLEGKTVGLTSGYAYSNLFKQAQQEGKIKFEVASSDLANFQKLLNGRIDVFPVERKVGKYLLEENFSAEERARLADHPKALDIFKPYLMLSKTNEENEARIYLFDLGFKRIKENGVYDNVMQACLQ